MDRCKHPACTCAALAANQQYCSEACQKAKATDRCECGHPDCGKR